MTEQQRAADAGRPVRWARAATATRLAWVGILTITAAFHVVRGAPVDAAIYGAGAALLVLDQLGWLRVPLRLQGDRQAHSRHIIAGVLIAVGAVTFALSPLYGAADTAVVVGIGVLLLPVAWADRDRAAVGRAFSPAQRAAVRRAAVLWSLVLAGGCLWEVAVYFLGRGSPGGEQDFPALSDLLDPVLAWPPARGVLAALWLLGGYALIRRGWRR